MKKAFDKSVNVIVGTMRLGSWGQNFNKNQWQKFIDNCLELGLNHFDHADIYGDYTTEADFGKVLKGNTSLREQLHLTTKCGINRVCENRPNHKIKSYDCSSTHIRKSVEQSLKNLNTDYIDCLLLHRPDYLMDIYDVADCVNSLIQEGKIISFGVSNFLARQFSILNKLVPLVTNQFEASASKLQAFENGQFDECHLNKIRPMIWSPLAGGAIFNPQSVKEHRIFDCAKDLSEKYNCQIDELLYAFLFSHPSKPIVVTGTTKTNRLKAAKNAVSIRLNKTDWYALWQASTGETIA